MRFFRWFGFEDFNLEITTERLGVAILCAILNIGSTFTPIIHTPHIYLGDIPADLSNSRMYILTVEVLGIGFNLVGLRRWAAFMLFGTVSTLIADFIYALNFTNSLNDQLAADPTVHYTQWNSLGWGWWFVILGPMIMGWVLLRDYLRENPQK
jgi:hypothetical protein